MRSTIIPFEIEIIIGIEYPTQKKLYFFPIGKKLYYFPIGKK